MPVTVAYKPSVEDTAEGKLIKLGPGSGNAKITIAGNATTVMDFEFPTGAKMTVEMADAKVAFQIQTLTSDVVEKLCVSVLRMRGLGAWLELTACCLTGTFIFPMASQPPSGLPWNSVRSPSCPSSARCA